MNPINSDIEFLRRVTKIDGRGKQGLENIRGLLKKILVHVLANSRAEINGSQGKVDIAEVLGQCLGKTQNEAFSRENQDVVAEIEGMCERIGRHFGIEQAVVARTPKPNTTTRILRAALHLNANELRMAAFEFAQEIDPAGRSLGTKILDALTGLSKELDTNGNETLHLINTINKTKKFGLLGAFTPEERKSAVTTGVLSRLDPDAWGSGFRAQEWIRTCLELERETRTPEAREPQTEFDKREFARAAVRDSLLGIRAACPKKEFEKAAASVLSTFISGKWPKLFGQEPEKPQAPKPGKPIKNGMGTIEHMMWG